MAVPLYYAADLFGRRPEIVDNVVRLTIAGLLGIQPVARAHKKGDRSHGPACLNIGAFISDEKPAAKTAGVTEYPLGFLDESGLRFAAGAGITRQMRTGVNPVHGCTFVREEIDHALIDRCQSFKRAIPAANDGLIADNHDRTAELIQHSNPFGGSRE
jgi:hypothetical protein